MTDKQTAETESFEEPGPELNFDDCTAILQNPVMAHCVMTKWYGYTHIYNWGLASREACRRLEAKPYVHKCANPDCDRQATAMLGNQDHAPIPWCEQCETPPPWEPTRVLISFADFYRTYSEGELLETALTTWANAKGLKGMEPEQLSEFFGVPLPANTDGQWTCASGGEPLGIFPAPAKTMAQAAPPITADQGCLALIQLPHLARGVIAGTTGVEHFALWRGPLKDAARRLDQLPLTIECENKSCNRQATLMLGHPKCLPLPWCGRCDGEPVKKPCTELRTFSDICQFYQHPEHLEEAIEKWVRAKGLTDLSGDGIEAFFARPGSAD